MTLSSQASRNVCTETLISEGTVIVGDIIFSGGLRIDGEVTGKVSGSDGQPTTLTVGEKGRINGSVAVVNAVIHGTVNGDVCATGHVTAFPSAKINCDLAYGRLELYLGAVVQGRLSGLDAN